MLIGLLAALSQDGKDKRRVYRRRCRQPREKQNTTSQQVKALAMVSCLAAAGAWLCFCLSRGQPAVQLVLRVRPRQSGLLNMHMCCVPCETLIAVTHLLASGRPGLPSSPMRSPVLLLPHPIRCLCPRTAEALLWRGFWRSPISRIGRIVYTPKPFSAATPSS